MFNVFGIIEKIMKGLLIQLSSVLVIISSNTHFFTSVCSSSVLTDYITEKLPKCYQNAYTKGRWVHDVTLKKSFYCCGWDDLDFKHDSQKCYNNTDYSHANLFLFKGSSDKLAHSGGHGCSCDAKGSRYSVLNVTVI